MHEFCRGLLKEVMKDVRKYVPIAQRRYAWTHKPITLGNPIFEFHGPGDFYWSGQACCKWHARYTGWGYYLRKLGVEGYE